jgi:hypothetical protein
VIPDAYQKRIPFQPFQSFHRFAQFQMGSSPFQSFKPFNRFAPFKTSDTSRRFKVQEFNGNFHVSRILETSKELS